MSPSVEWQIRALEMWSLVFDWFQTLCNWTVNCMARRKRCGYNWMSQIYSPCSSQTFISQSSSAFTCFSQLRVGINWITWQKVRPRDGIFLGSHSVSSETGLLAAILALTQSCCICWKLTAKSSVSGLSVPHHLVLVTELDLLWVPDFGTCLFIHWAIRHLVSSWNVPGIVPVTGLTVINRADPKLEAWGRLCRDWRC